jgi:hypothetical protein
MRRAVLGVAIMILAGCEHLPFTDDDTTTVPSTMSVTTEAPTTTRRPAQSNRPVPISPRARAQVTRVRREIDCADVRQLKRRHPRWTPARVQEDLATGVFPRQKTLTPPARRALRQILADCGHPVGRGG